MCALATLLLWEAVDRGDLSAVRRLVGRVPDLDARHSMVCLSGPSAPRDSELTALLHCQSDYTALSIAAARGYTNILLLLLRAGANPLAKAPVVRCVHLLGRVLRLCSHRAAIACAEWLDRSPLRCGSGPCGCHGSFARGRK